MVIGLITIATVVIGIAFATKHSLRRPRMSSEEVANERRQTGWQSFTGGSSYAIPVTPQMERDENEDREETFRLLEQGMRTSSIFLSEKIPMLVRTLRDNAQLLGRTNTKPAFDGEVMLTVQEKSALGLNTRFKYTRTFIDNFDPSKLAGVEPKSMLENMHLAAANCVRSKRELAKLRAHGWVKVVEIEPCHDARDCERVRKAEKVYPIAEVPSLPLNGCDAPYCRCIYLAVLN